MQLTLFKSVTNGEFNIDKITFLQLTLIS